MTAHPRFAYAYPELALVAAHVRDQRAEGDPALVERGRMSAEDAAARLRIAATIATDWQHYAKRALPPLDATTQAEKVASLRTALAGHQARADRARAAIVNEYGEAFFVRTTAELWALIDTHDPTTARVRPYLHHESCAAALEAMLWWEQRPREFGIRFITRMNLDLRGMGYLPQERVAA